MLLGLIERLGKSAGEDLAGFGRGLRSWLEVQAGHASLRRILAEGPALALSAPLTLRARLGAAVEAALPVAELLKACERQKLLLQPMPLWRRLETEGLLTALGAATCARPLATVEADRGILSEALLYQLTHEAFHLTDFGRRFGAAPPRLREELDAGLDAAIEAAHLDLTAELVAARRCCGVSGDAREHAGWRLLWRAGPGEEVLQAYHLQLAIVLAALMSPTGWRRRPARV